MARFCTKCGKALSNGEKCSCQTNPTASSGAKKFMARALQRMGIGTPSDNSTSVFETGQKIVPDILKPNDGEIPIKQYEVATLRSRIRGQYAKGRLEVTNKRVIFRAAGMSFRGPIAQQYEFALGEVAGVEIKKKNRISFVNILLCTLLNTVVTLTVSEWFHDFAIKAPAFGMAVSILVSALCAVPFFAVRKKFWLKLALLCFGIGALTGTAALGNLRLSSLALGAKANIADFVVGIMYLLWLVNVLLVAMVPDLVLIVKTKGASPAFEIRRKQFPTPFRQMTEYTDFSEVLPGKDVDAMINELGALIDDIQTLGDIAIENWKE